MFFGIQHRTIVADSASEEDSRRLRDPACGVAFLASATGLLAASRNGLWDPQSLRNGNGIVGRMFVYGGSQPQDLPAAYALCSGAPPIELMPQSQEQMTIRFTDSHRDLCGPFSGITVNNVSSSGTPLLRALDARDSVIIDSPPDSGAALICRRCGDTDVFFSTAPRVLSLDFLIREKYFDIKKHLFELLPFILFIRKAFADEIYQTDDVKACLIVDDPRLIESYGHFNYRNILKKMRGNGFATNIGFIPWNYRRSDPGIVELVKTNSDRISVAVHGCDHTKAEFGTGDVDALNWLAHTAQGRMESHRARHALDYDRIMIFPQGVFSMRSAGALKRHNYWGAVNTDICACDDAEGVSLGETMDLAILKYSGFPIVTRRYLWHGLENFAFDILLGKPCLIVTHQQDFRNEAKQVLDGLDALSKLNAHLNWAPLGNVVRTLHKRQRHADGRESVRIYSLSSVIKNSAQSPIDATVFKAESDPTMLKAVLLDGEPVEWTSTGRGCEVHLRMGPAQSSHLQFQYKNDSKPAPDRNNLSRRVKVMLRRHLTEVRDQYLS